LNQGLGGMLNAKRTFTQILMVCCYAFKISQSNSQILYLQLP